MSFASSHQSFLINALALPKNAKTKNFLIPVHNTIISCRYQSDDSKNSTRKNEYKFAKLAMLTLAAGELTLGSIDPAAAAKSGGRVGGQAFRSSRSSRPSAPPRPSSPRINNSRNSVYINPPVAPPLVGGYGYGYGVTFYGGWGCSPFSFFAPGPSVAIGVGGGFDTLAFFLFLGAAAAVVRRFFGSREEDDDY